MECNRDEAIRAKELSEKKFTENDIAGAKKWALKAHKLYPNLDGLSQLIATFDVYIYAQEKKNGVVDWYGVLGVEPSANVETIKKHYHTLALFLHPDKNRSVGAEGAFSILSEGWGLLSDKAKRIAYDQKRNETVVHFNVPNKGSASSMPSSQGSSSNISPDTMSQKSNSPMKSSIPPHPTSKTFWTTCIACKMQFEYFRTYLNVNLLCPNCHQHFLAVETPTPPIYPNDPPILSKCFMHGKNSHQHTSKNPSARGMPPPRSSGVNLSNAFTKSSIDGNAPEQVFLSAQAQGVALPEFGQSKSSGVPISDMKGIFQMKARYAYEKPSSGISIGSAKDNKSKKKRRVDEDRKNSIAAGMRNLVCGLPVSRKRVFEAGKTNTPNLRTKMPQMQTRDMLMMKAKQTILMKFDGLKFASVTSDKELTKKKKQETESSAMYSEKTDVNKCVKSVDNKPTIESSESPFARSDVDPSTEQSDMLTMTVPDPDFHNFDDDRTENSFEKNQVWATYDDDDGMPRYYAMIDDVVSLKPFRMRIRWLRSKSNDELAPINWINSGYCKTSGDFRVGKYDDNKSLNSFSHKVNWTKGKRGVIMIYPKEGDVWALYRNWSSDWNEFTPDEVIQKYDMVEVLNDYNEERGVKVVPLVKVAGFKTVFCRDPEPSKTRTVPKKEMFRFSHQVPSYLLLGQEGHNAPSGCLELDPAAVPLEFLQVLTEAQLREMESATEKVKEHIMVGNVGKAEEGKLVETAKFTEKAVVEVIGKEVGGKSKEEKLGKSGETTNEEAIIAEATGKVFMADSMMKGKETKESKTLMYRRKQKRQKI